MTLPWRCTLFAWLALVSGAVGCSRSNLDAITRMSGTGGSAGSGGSSDGGSGTGSGGAPASGGATGTGGTTTVTCPSPVLAAGDTAQTVTVGSTSRNYYLHVPTGYTGTKPVPLILEFHALTGTGVRQRQGSLYPAQTDPDGAIMAFPTGLPGPLGNGWNVGPCCVADVDDVAFVRTLVKQVQGLACIDSRRIYAVGTSMGGGMAYYLACRASDLFAAIAPSAFDLMAEELPECNLARPVTVISFRGTADQVVPYEGGPSSTVPGMPVTFLGALGTFRKWAELDDCTDVASAEDGNGCSTYSSCQGGVEVTLCTKQGGGQESGNASIAWPVLKRHTL